MANKQKNGPRAASDYFVVGGPVQPDRSCYVEREADQELYWHLKDGEYCYILGPRQIGKTSLIARTAKRLRDDGVLVAIVDLTQIGSREQAEDPGRWYYGIAYRIVRELRLKLNLQRWWQDRSSLSVLQRLVEFFWEIVLAHTTAPIVIFFDEIERTVPLPYSDDFFASLRVCYNARVTERDYRRLSFVIAGAATPAQLVNEASQGPFTVAKRIELSDFKFEQSAPLMRGLGLSGEQSEHGMRRILYWTGGQPFLTQKLCRAVVRAGGDTEVETRVDELCRERFLARNSVRDEPNLNFVRNTLTTPSRKRAFSLLTLYGRVCKDHNILADVGSPDTDILLVSGIVRLSRKQTFLIRNRIYRRVFTPGWVNQNLPFDWKGFVAAVSISALILAIPIWYTQFLPRPYIETLSAATEDYQLALDAYHDLRAIPGYADTADRLFAGVIARRSRRATDYASVMEADAALRNLPGNSELADKLLAEFWKRRAQLAEAKGERDQALLFHLTSQTYAAGVPLSSVTHLTQGDYQRLVATIRPGSEIQDIALHPAGESVTTVIHGNLIQVWDLRSGRAEAQPPLAVVAEDFVPVIRHLNVEEPGEVSRLELTVKVGHPEPEQLFLHLASPSGKTVELSLVRGVRRGAGEYRFSTDRHVELAALAGEKKPGSWTLTIEDRVTGETGTLAGWSLRLGQLVSDNPVAGVSPMPAIPDPRTTEQVIVILSRSGEYAAVRSQDMQARGFTHIWRIKDRALTTRIPRRTGAEFMAFGPKEEVIVTSAPDGRAEIGVWSVTTGAQVLAIQPFGAFSSRPSLSPAGHFLAVGDKDAGNNRFIRVWDLAAGVEVDAIDYNTEFSRLAISAGAELLATLDRDQVVRVWRIATRELVGEFKHSLPLVAMHFEPSGRWLATKDNSYYARVWDIRNSAKPPRPTAQVASLHPNKLSFSPDGDGVAVHPSPGSYEILQLPGGNPVGAPLRHPYSPGEAGRTHEVSHNSIATFSQDGTQVLTGTDGRVARIWKLDVMPGGIKNAFCGRFAVVSGALGPEGDRWAAACGDGRVLQWSAGEEHPRELPVGELTAFGDIVHTLVFSSDGAVLAAGTRRGAVRLWDVAGGAPRELGIQHDRGAIFALVFSPDGRQLITAGELGARLWNASTGAAGDLLGANDPIRSVAFSADGSLVAMGNESGVVTVWRLPEKEVVGAVEMAGTVSAVAFGLNGTSLVIGTNQGDVVLWDRITGLKLGQPRNVGAEVLHTSVSPNGSHVLVQTHDWIHLFVMGRGLQPRVSRLLPNVPLKAAVRFSDSRVQEVAVMLGMSDRAAPDVLSVRRERMTGSAWDARPLLSDWEAKLQLTIDEDGQIVPVGGADTPLLSQE